MAVSVRVEMAPDWQARMYAGVGGALERLGALILGDAQRYVPVDTGRLLLSLGCELVPGPVWPEAWIGSFEDDEGPVKYAAAVELGFHGEEWVREYVNHDFMGTGEAVLIRAHARHGNTPEQPYLRPALYQERDI